MTPEEYVAGGYDTAITTWQTIDVISAFVTGIGVGAWLGIFVNILLRRLERRHGTLIFPRKSDSTNQSPSAAPSPATPDRQTGTSRHLRTGS